MRKKNQPPRWILGEEAFYMNRNAVQIFSAVEKFNPCTTLENNMSNIDMKY